MSAVLRRVALQYRRVERWRSCAVVWRSVRSGVGVRARRVLLTGRAALVLRGSRASGRRRTGLRVGGVLEGRVGRWGMGM